MKLLIALLLFSFCAIAQDKIPSLTIRGHAYSNATIRVIDSTTGIVTSETGGAKILLTELPEPYRSKYYDEEKINRERELAAKIKAEKDRAAKAQAAAEEAKKRVEAEAQKTKAAAAIMEAQKPYVENTTIQISQPDGVSRQYGGMKITGTLKNMSKTRLKTLSIRFSVYDGDGNKVGSAIDYMSELESGESWKFEANSSKGGETYKLESVNCSHGKLY